MSLLTARDSHRQPEACRAHVFPRGFQMRAAERKRQSAVEEHAHVTTDPDDVRD
ncbi:putative antitoxin of wHTH fold [Halalkaliarchaeum sp. AArc-CO]|nr:putative antitoxin of wHTH fold [Halalkaliarchaeum sp. AArc-CO]